MPLRLLDTFSGIGGFSYAAERIVGGFETVAFVEREPYCQQILSKHWPSVPIYDDITTFSPEPYSADVVCGGFPCQDISTAGNQAGIKEGTRSGLFYELMRVIRLVRPRYVVLENVSAIISNGLDTVLGELAEAGYDCEWACIRASDVGACHRRARIWIVAYANHCRQDAAHTNAQRLLGSHVELSTMHGSKPGGKVGMEDGSGTWAQQWPQWRAGNQSLNPDWRSYVSVPVLYRGDDGLSNRVDRLKALGNAVVPQVAAIPLARVLNLHHNA